MTKSAVPTIFADWVTAFSIKGSAKRFWTLVEYSSIARHSNHAMGGTFYKHGFLSCISVRERSSLIIPAALRRSSNLNHLVITPVPGACLTSKTVFSQDKFFRVTLFRPNYCSASGLGSIQNGAKTPNFHTWLLSSIRLMTSKFLVCKHKHSVDNSFRQSFECDLWSLYSGKVAWSVADRLCSLLQPPTHLLRVKSVREFANQWLAITNHIPTRKWYM